MSWRVTLSCTRAEAERLPEADDLFAFSHVPPVLVADEPDPHRSDDWLLHAYFEEQPTTQELILLTRLAENAAPEVEHLADADWVTLSQAGLEPIRAGRFFVHTPAHRDKIPDDAIAFEIDAGLAFGTGQHATTAGCLQALDHLASSGETFANIADIGTGTGLLAFAALALWPKAEAIATDIDPVSIDVTRDNAASNGITLGRSAGELHLIVADGMAHREITDRSPYDLVIANILAGPLIDLAPAFAHLTKTDGTVVLAGLLDTQRPAVTAAFEQAGFTSVDNGTGEWPVLVLHRN